jgi:DNA-directed RNA polymerase specialized sigma24 family protein
MSNQESQSLFPQTHWTVVAAARSDDPAASDEARALLFVQYWKPLYVFVRGRGLSPHDAEDHVQGFLGCLLEGDAFAKVDVDGSQGRLRAYLIQGLKNYLKNVHRQDTTVKRGGGAIHLSMDVDMAEASFGPDLVENATPESLFEKRWALTVLETALERLKAEYEERGKAEAFEVLKDTLMRNRERVNFRDLGKQLDTTEGNARVMAHRMRQGLRVRLREEVALTVTNYTQLEEEMRYLIGVLGSTPGT